jgi:hypothetical protein
MKKHIATIFAFALVTVIGTSAVQAQDATSKQQTVEVTFCDDSEFIFRALPTSVSRDLATLSHGTTENEVNVNLANPGKYMVHVKSLDNRTIYFERIWTRGTLHRVDLSDAPSDIYLMEIVDAEGFHQEFEIAKLK